MREPDLRVRVLLAAALSVAGVVAPSCTALGFGPSHYKIRVDSIVAPETQPATENMVLRFVGWVGPNACYQLEGVEKTKSAGQFDITFRGVFENKGCAPTLMILDHYDTLAPPFDNPFTVHVSQPNGSILTRTIVVR